MNTNKLIILLLSGPVAVVLLLTVIKIILRKLKAGSEEDFRLRPAYGLYFSGMLIAGMLIQLIVIGHIAEAADNIQKNATPSPLTETAKIAVLFTGLGVIWFFLWFLVTGVFTAVLLGIKKEAEEMLLGNTYYFLIKSVLLVGFAILMSPVFALLLRWLMPGISVAFIH